MSEPTWGFHPQLMERILLRTPDGKPLVEGNTVHFPLDPTPTEGGRP